MIITYYGNTCVRLQSGSVSLLVDPDTNRLKGDVVLRTTTPTSSLSSTLGTAEEISFPGEYEAKGMGIKGIALPEESNEKVLKTLYVVTWEEIRAAFLGTITHPLDAQTLEELELVDVLFLPVSGAHAFSP